MVYSIKRKRFYHRSNEIDRFWSKVKKSNKCWIWKCCLTSSGYGIFINENREHIRSHRYSWSLHNGPIPKEILVLHHCDNRPCVRPSHLFLGTHLDNMRDMNLKGRHVPRRILKEWQVRKIKTALKNKSSTYLELGKKYGVEFSTIGSIAKNRTWKWVIIDSLHNSNKAGLR